MDETAKEKSDRMYLEANKVLKWFFTSKYSAKKGFDTGAPFNKTDLSVYGPTSARKKDTRDIVMKILYKVKFIEHVKNGKGEGWVVTAKAKRSFDKFYKAS
jgi:hypothetical protein